MVIWADGKKIEWEKSLILKLSDDDKTNIQAMHDDKSHYCIFDDMTTEEYRNQLIKQIKVPTPRPP